MTVQIEKPKDKLKRAVKKLSGKAFASKLLAAAKEGSIYDGDPEDDIDMEILPDYIDQSVTRMR